MATIKRHDEIAFAWIQENSPEKIPDQATVRILHDLWCASWYSPSCDCFPEILVNEQQISYPLEMLKIA